MFIIRPSRWKEAISSLPQPKPLRLSEMCVFMFHVTLFTRHHRCCLVKPTEHVSFTCLTEALISRPYLSVITGDRCVLKLDLLKKLFMIWWIYAKTTVPIFLGTVLCECWRWLTWILKDFKAVWQLMLLIRLNVWNSWSFFQLWQKSSDVISSKPIESFLHRAPSPSQVMSCSGCSAFSGESERLGRPLQTKPPFLTMMGVYLLSVHSGGGFQKWPSWSNCRWLTASQFFFLFVGFEDSLYSSSSYCSRIQQRSMCLWYTQRHRTSWDFQDNASCSTFIDFFQ